MAFIKEADFEPALIEVLIEYCWEPKILHNYMAEQLIQDWADILYTNVCEN